MQYEADAQLPGAVLRDADGNTYSCKMMPGNKEWMTTNLNTNMPGAYNYELAAQQKLYGRLYTWEAAKKGCALLGNGWRLPTADDWRQLAVYYGGVPEDSAESRKKAYQALLNGGVAGFNALLGGGRRPDGQYARVDAHGFYWMATETDSSLAWFANFGKDSQQLYRQNDGEKISAMCVRCIRDAGK